MLPPNSRVAPVVAVVMEAIFALLLRVATCVLTLPTVPMFGATDLWVSLFRVTPIFVVHSGSRADRPESNTEPKRPVDP